MKRLFIIPGYGSTTRSKPYKSIAAKAVRKGFDVVMINPDWKKALSKQLLEVGTQDVIFAFSLGGILAIFSAAKSPCKKIILASATTYLCADDLEGKLPKRIVEDIRNTKGLKIPRIVRFYGELEKTAVKEYVPKSMKIKKYIPATEHTISDAYIKAIVGEL